MNTLARALRLVAAGAALATVAGCGGGIYVDGVFAPGPPPDVSMVASVSSAARGDRVHLVAAVAASNGVDHVSFYRVDTGPVTRLGTVYAPPAQWDTTIPMTAGSSVDYFATACDSIGFCSDSNVVTVTVVP
jgi:hypothetical protein